MYIPVLVFVLCRVESHVSLGSGRAIVADGPASLQSVWDNVITWMRQAVEFVGLDKNADGRLQTGHDATVRRGASLVAVLFKLALYLISF